MSCSATYLLGQGVGRLASVGTGHHWHHAGVNHPEVLDAVHAEGLVDNTAKLQWQHGRCAYWVVVSRRQGAGDVGLEVGVRGDVGAGGVLDGGKLLGERRLKVVAADELDALDKEVDLDGVGQGAVVDDGLRVPGVGRVDVDAAAAEGLHRHGALGALVWLEHHAGEGRVLGAHLRGQELHLRLVARDHGGVGVSGQETREVLLLQLGGELLGLVRHGGQGKPAGKVAERDGVRARLVGCPYFLGPVLELVSVHQVTGVGVDIRDLGDCEMNRSDHTHSTEEFLVSEPGGQLTSDVHCCQTAVVLEVLANAGQVHENVNTAGLEDILGADTAQLQQLRSMNSAGRHNDLLVRLDGDKGAVGRLELDSRGRQVVIHNESAGQGVGQEMVIGPSGVDVEIVTCTGIGAGDSPGVLEGREPEHASLSSTTVCWELNAVELLECLNQGVHAWVVEPGPAGIDLRGVTPVRGIILDSVKVLSELRWRLGKV